jgi:hypothetical protein
MTTRLVAFGRIGLVLAAVPVAGYLTIVLVQPG